jgi:hypothetical protein
LTTVEDADYMQDAKAILSVAFDITIDCANVELAEGGRKLLIELTSGEILVYNWYLLRMISTS